MIYFIKDLIEEAKASENHTAVKCMSYSELMKAVEMSNNSFVDFCEEMSDYMKKNGCSFSYVEEGMMPVIKVVYNKFESDGMFDGAKFGKVYVTRKRCKALYIAKVGNEHKLYIENGGASYYNSDGTHKCLSELDDFETPKQYSEYDIIAEWNEPIDEKELHTLAEENNPYEFYGYYETLDADNLHTIFNKGFKIGYRKAKGQ